MTCTNGHELAAADRFCTTCGAEAASAAPAAPAGWHPDPYGSVQLRYWDGVRWTDHLHDDPARATQAAQAAPPSAATGNVAAAAPGGAASTVLSGAVSDFKALPISMLFPVRDWWRDKIWVRGWTAIFLGAMLIPFFLLYLASTGSDFKDIARGLAAYFGVLWLLGIRALIRPQNVQWQLIAGVAAFTMFVAIPVAIALEKGGAEPGGLLGWILRVGLVEEGAKAAAILGVVLWFDKNRTLELRDYLFLGATSGIAFGAAEAALYTQLYGSGYSSGAETISVSVWRLVSGPALHMAWAGILAVFIAFAAKHRNAAVPLVVVGLAFVAALHGLYDDESNSFFGLIVAAFSALVFTGYLHTGEQISVDLDDRLAGLGGWTGRAANPTEGG